MPTLTYDGIGDPDLSTIASYVSSLAGAGAQLFPDIELENALRRRGGLPERDRHQAEGVRKVAEAMPTVEHDAVFGDFDGIAQLPLQKGDAPSESGLAPLIALDPEPQRSETLIETDPDTGFVTKLITVKMPVEA